MSAQAIQAAAIPFRSSDGTTEFCLITTSSGTRWTVPKGIIERGDTAGETALKEAREEAGLHGELVGGPVGHYRHAKWGTTFGVEVYLMKVTREDEDWEERSFRQRRWVVARDALAVIDRHPIAAVFRSAVAGLDGTRAAGSSGAMS